MRPLSYSTHETDFDTRETDTSLVFIVKSALVLISELRSKVSPSSPYPTTICLMLTVSYKPILYSRAW